MDEKGVGRDIGEWTAKKLGGKGKIAFLGGPAGAPTFRNLWDGYSEAISKYPGIQVVFRNDGPLTRERGVKQAEDVMVAHPDVAAIYCANDDIALGAQQAVTAAGKKGQILVTGMNGVPPALRAVKEGGLSMTVELNPVLWGRLGVDVLAGYLKGEKFQQQVFIKHVVIDGSNIDDVLKRM
jgi:ribose transport system substrate-binding protein